MVQHIWQVSWSDWNSNLKASCCISLLVECFCLIYCAISLVTHNTCTHTHTHTHTHTDIYIWSLIEYTSTSLTLYSLRDGNWFSRGKQSNFRVRIAKPKDSAYQAAFPKYTPLKMLYCTRALVDKASYCIHLVTWLLDNGFSSKNKSVTQGV